MRSTLTFDFCHSLGVSHICFDFLCMFCSNKLVNKLMFGSHNNISHTKNGIRASGEDLKIPNHIIFEDYRGTFRLTNPISLHSLRFLRPVQTIKTGKQFFCIISNLEKPLIHILNVDIRATSFALALLYLFSCKNSLAGRAPICGCGFLVSKTSLVQLTENPLGPLIVFWITCHNLIRPVEHSAHLFQLTTHNFDILHGAVIRMSSGLYCIVLSRESECIKTHGLKHIKALHLFEPSIAIY